MLKICGWCQVSCHLGFVYSTGDHELWLIPKMVIARVLLEGNAIKA